ncbi:hypothetical protein RMATCC62417_17530 [Rhizopus microsporus]|nr:hypothetical protein RMATCC62417_17530 [Rhizopus microsporus]
MYCCIYNNGNQACGSGGTSGDLHRHADVLDWGIDMDFNIGGGSADMTVWKNGFAKEKKKVGIKLAGLAGLWGTCTYNDKPRKDCQNYLFEACIKTSGSRRHCCEQVMLWSACAYGSCPPHGNYPNYC